MFPTKILLAVDGSPGSARAARVAVGLSGALDSELRVVLVGGHRPTSGAVPGWPALDADYEPWAREAAGRDARQRLEEQLQEIRARDCEVSGAYSETGRPDAEIVRLSQDLGAGLVVVGSRGHGPLKRAVMGSVSLSVVRHARCPVLVVRGDGEDVLSSPILIGDDGSQEADEASRAGMEISAALGVDLHVIHTLDPEAYMPYTGPEIWEGWQADLARAERGARSWVKQRAVRLREEGGPKTVEAHLALGDPDLEIVRLAGELGAGLVIIGSRGLGGVRRMLLGSVSDSVVRHAYRSVMVVRAGKSGRE